MTIPRLFMMFAMVLVLVGLIYAVTDGGGERAAQAMYVELGCLAVGALVFYLAWAYESRRGS